MEVGDRCEIIDCDLEGRMWPARHGYAELTLPVGYSFIVEKTWHDALGFVHNGRKVQILKCCVRLVVAHPQIHTCTCELTTLMAEGCRCGGV